MGCSIWWKVGEWLGILGCSIGWKVGGWLGIVFNKVNLLDPGSHEPVGLISRAKSAVGRRKLNVLFWASNSCICWWKVGQLVFVSSGSHDGIQLTCNSSSPDAEASAGRAGPGSLPVGRSQTHFYQAGAALSFSWQFQTRGHQFPAAIFLAIGGAFSPSSQRSLTMLGAKRHGRLCQKPCL
eukprot:1156206-Pelagomonas_calceolata.AAC.1